MKQETGHLVHWQFWQMSAKPALMTHLVTELPYGSDSFYWEGPVSSLWLLLIMGLSQADVGVLPLIPSSLILGRYVKSCSAILFGRFYPFFIAFLIFFIVCNCLQDRPFSLHWSSTLFLSVAIISMSCVLPICGVILIHYAAIASYFFPSDP